MKILKSYTRIWSVEKVIYAINDFRLPFPVTFNQMTWFVLSLFVVILLGNLPPLSMIDGALLKYVGVPVLLTWFMSKKSFDCKKPYGFHKTVKLQKQTFNETITVVRSEVHGLSD